MVHIAESSHNWSKEMLDMKCGGGVLCDRFCIFILQTEWWPSNKPKSHMDMLAKVYTLLCHKLFGLLSGVMQWVASMLFWIRHRWIPQIHCCSVACQHHCFSNSIGEGITEECLCRIHFFSLCLILLSFRNSTNFKMITYILSIRFCSNRLPA